MYDPTFTATSAHLNDLGRAASRQPLLRPHRRASQRPEARTARAGTILAVSLVGIVTTGLIALQGMIA